MLSADQVSDLVKAGVEAGIKAANTVNPEDRPAAAKEAPAFHKQRGIPSLGLALKATFNSYKRRAGTIPSFEMAVAEASAELFDFEREYSHSIVWPKSADEMRQVLDEMGEKGSVKEMDRLSVAIKAMNEGTTTAGGHLVPPEYRQQDFEYALSPEVALKRVPGVKTMPVASNVVKFPRETTRAGASQQSEAGSLTAQDAVFDQQSITIEKQYAYRQFSNELLADANPSLLEFLANSVVRDLGIQMDIQFLRGTGASPQITGLLSYSGLTTGPSLGTNGASPTHDNLLDAVYLLEAANSRAVDFAIAHPRVANSLRKVKDGMGRYLWEPNGVPGMGGDGFLLGSIPLFKTTNLLITQTVGSSTDCTTIIMGDSSKVVILERQGIELATSEHVAFANDQTAVRAIARSAVALLQPAAVELITGVRA